MNEQRLQKLHELAGRGLSVPHTAYTDIDRDFPTSQTRAWEWWAAAWPYPNRFNTGDQHQSIVEDAQESWLLSSRFVDEQLELRAEYEAQKTAEAAERQKEADAYEAARLSRLTEELRRQYLAVPGATEAEFQADLPGMLRERARAAAMGDASDAPVIPAHRMW